MHLIIFTPAARAEIIETWDWYEAIMPGLGTHFQKALDEAITRISSNPQMFALIFQDVRRVLLHKFPYSLFFRIEQDAIYIIACFHGSRNPLVWQQRV